MRIRIRQEYPYPLLRSDKDALYTGSEGIFLPGTGCDVVTRNSGVLMLVLFRNMLCA